METFNDFLKTPPRLDPARSSHRVSGPLQVGVLSGGSQTFITLDHYISEVIGLEMKSQFTVSVTSLVAGCRL